MEKKYPLSETEFKLIYSKVPRLCVDLLIQNNEGILLTLRKIPPAGFWHLPGGTVLINESMTNAVHRVAREELNLKVKIIKQVGVIDWLNYLGLGHPVSIVYLAKIIEGEIKLDEQASKFEFFKNIPQNTFKEHTEFLKEFFKKNLILK